MTFWYAAVALSGMLAFGLPIEGELAAVVAAILLIGGGLPHGAYDIALMRQVLRMDDRLLAMAVAGYVAAAICMALLWMVMPIAALIVFLAVAAVHFGEDWTMLNEPLLKIMAGAAVLGAAAIGNTADVTALFVAMSDVSGGTLAARILVTIAPVALLVTAVGIAIAWRDGAVAWAAAIATSLVLLLVAPPIAGFALFFVFLHSPRHLAATRALLPMISPRAWWITGIAMSCLAVAGWLAIRWSITSPLPPGLTAQIFQLLAVVAVPHLIVSTFIARRIGR